MGITGLDEEICDDINRSTIQNLAVDDVGYGEVDEEEGVADRSTTQLTDR